jgi:formylglycine-generating enzyme required for sulfatase activity
VIVSKAFWLGQHEVTQKQFLEVLQRNPSRHTGTDTDDFPVDSVTWNDAAEFCRKLSDRSDEKSAGRVYRLPTEAEWEYACRSGSALPYIWTQTRQDDDSSGENSGMRPSLPITGVGSYKPNSFGLYDMRGNVWEWTADWFDREYYRRSPTEDPQGPARGFIKVVRGSDWTFIGETCRINYPMMPPWKSSQFVGFRVVCTPSL